MARALLIIFWLVLLPFNGPAAADTSAAAPATSTVHLWFFWSQNCGHCLEALPFVDGLVERYPWLELHSHEISADPQGAAYYAQLARAMGQDARSVPAFLFCGEMYAGFDSAAASGQLLEQRLLACHGGEAVPPPPEVSVDLPGVGSVGLEQWSLPLVTVMLAGMDAFNPCAFFVLLFLLSLLVHQHSRARMLVVGGVFVMFSGLVYFALMAAWLNVFLWAGEMRIVTLAAGVLATLMALFNIKDYWGVRRGPTLSIPASAKPRLYARARALLHVESWPIMIAGTVVLAMAANSYELLCTAGFPLVYTRLLTLHALSGSDYYAFLALYNVVYVLPLIAVVLIFVRALNSRKLTVVEGRLLKLVSGVMMLGLGGALLVAPQVLSNPWAALVLIGLALAIGALAWRRERRAKG